jgi:flagellar hook-basal body complex protein FliE
MAMEDLRIGKISPLPPGPAEFEKAAPHDPISDFKKILGKSVEEVDKLLTEANESAGEMVAGRMDIHQAMVAMEQANVSFRLMIQVRNKMMAAYEEIMRMQV